MRVVNVECVAHDDQFDKARGAVVFADVGGRRSTTAKGQTHMGQGQVAQVARWLAECGKLAGEVLVDCTNPLKFTPGTGLELASATPPPAAEPSHNGRQARAL